MRISPIWLIFLGLVLSPAMSSAMPQEPTKQDPAKQNPGKQNSGAKAEATEDGAAGKASASQKQAATDLAAKVKELIKQLDDPSAANRDAAEKALVELGPGVTTLLPRVTPRTSAEVKDRLLRISKSLDKAAADEIVKPTALTLPGEMPLTKVLEEIEKQTGNKIVDMRSEEGDTSDVVIAAKMTNLPFWQGVDQILDETGLSVEGSATESNTLSLIMRPEGQSPRLGKASYGGPFRFEAVELEAVRSLRTENMERLKVFMEASWEPRLRPVFFEQKLEDVIAKDEAGKVIPIDGAEGDLEVDMEFDATLIELEIPLKLPSRDVKKISSLKGKGSVVLLGRDATFEFSNIAKAKEVKQTQAGVTVVLESVAKFDDVYEVAVRVELDNAQGALESFRAGVFSSEGYLQTSNLEKVENDGEESSREGDNVMGTIYQFVLDEKDDISKYKFIFKTPVTVIRMPVEYELKDIELP